MKKLFILSIAISFFYIVPLNAQTTIIDTNDIPYATIIKDLFSIDMDTVSDPQWLYAFKLNAKVWFVEGILHENNKIYYFIRSFYFEYITEICGSSSDWITIEKIKEKYCHNELLARIKKLQENYELNYDPFLNAQDCDLEWLKTLSIKPDTKENAWFTVSYSYTDYSNNKKYVEIRLKIVSVNDSYYILDVEGL